jgi:hypothetical protein
MMDPMLNIPKTQKRRTSWWLIPLLGVVVLTFVLSVNEFSQIATTISVGQ